MSEEVQGNSIPEDQQKAEQLRKAALKKKIKLAAITIGVLCLIIIVS